MKKLYEVHVEFTYYAMADSEDEAELLCSDAFNDEEKSGIAEARSVTNSKYLAWGGDSLVYGADEGMTLDQAIALTGIPG